MENAKHTPGPWLSRTSLDSDGLTCKIVVEDINGANIAECSPHGHSQLKGENNARLIAAAPELLKACEAVYAAGTHVEKAFALDKVIDAIAKAKGN